MKTSFAICTSVILVAGCVADTMRGYVGQDIRAVVLAYGPPANEIDLGGGTRASRALTCSSSRTGMRAPAPVSACRSCGCRTYCFVPKGC